MKRILVLLAIVTVFVSCQKDFESPMDSSHKRVTLYPTITRATELAFEDGDKIGLTIVKADQSKHADNVEMSFAEGLFTGNVNWYEDANATSQIIAYYPYASTGMSTSFTVASDQTTGYGASDLMGAVKSDVKPSKDALEMMFQHLMTKIVINVAQSDANITSVVLKNSIPTATVDFAALSATVNSSSVAADITAQAVTSQTLYRAIVVPQTVAFTLAITTDKGETLTQNLTSATLKQGGQYSINFKIAEGKLSVSISGGIDNWTDEGELNNEEVIDPKPEGATAYVTKVLDFMPAVGQFTNTLPVYTAGDTQETMNAKALAAINNSKKGGMISLGGFGGYVVVGFDHTIANVKGKRDFRVLGNSFFADANPRPDAPEGGSCEPGVIMVAYDANKNGKPDDDEWFEIAGSSHIDPTLEPWYAMAVGNGNDVNLYRNYEITYYKPESEPAKEDWGTYIRWEDNQGKSGYKVKNQFHAQCYYPLWATGDKITFKGTCLPQNGIDESGIGNYFVLYKFRYGYSDNELDKRDESGVDIDWAVNSKGEKVYLPGVDFIKIYTGVNQENGWLGECSTEVTGVEDLHVLGVDINTIVQ